MKSVFLTNDSEPENEYTNPMLFKVISFIDKTATCNSA